MLTDAQRRIFDRLLEAEIDRLPEQVRTLLEEVPIVVEDRPSRRLLRDMGLDPDDELYGLYHGHPRIDRSVLDPARLPEQVMIFREPILRLAGRDRDELREQIRITLVHEIGHHFGFDEDDLDQMGLA